MDFKPTTGGRQKTNLSKILGPRSTLETLKLSSFAPIYAMVQFTPKEAFVFIVIACLAVALVCAVFIGGVICVDHILGGHKKQ